MAFSALCVGVLLYGGTVACTESVCQKRLLENENGRMDKILVLRQNIVGHTLLAFLRFPYLAGRMLAV